MISELKDYYNQTIDSIMGNSPDYQSILDSTKTTFQKHKQTNDMRDSINSSIIDSVNTIRAKNDSIAAAYAANNDCQAALYQLTIPSRFQHLTNMASISNNFSNSINDYLTRLIDDKHVIDTIFIEAQQQCRNNKLFQASYIDSISHLFTNDSIELTSLLNEMEQYMTWVQTTNKEISDFHETIDWVTADIDTFNTKLSFCKVIRISDPLEIEVFIDTIEPGDTLSLDSGSINLDAFNIREKGNSSKPIVIKGAPQMNTVIYSPHISVEASTNIELINIVFTDTLGAEGVKVLENNGPVTFTHCIFTNNQAYGLAIVNSDSVYLNDCLFTNNGLSDSIEPIKKAGLRIEETDVVINNILSAGNIGFGIDIVEARVDINNGTIVTNTLDGIRYSGANLQGWVTLHSTIIAYNDRYGIFRDNEATTLDIILDPPDASKRNQFFNNQSGPLGGSQTIIEGNEGLYTIADPMFVAVDDGDFHLKPESPLYGSAIGYQYP